MKLKINLLAASAMAATMLAAPVSADDHMSAPSWGKVETIACQYNDGKSLVDLMGVVSKWNSWSNDQDLNNYFAWVLTPHYHSELNGGRTAFWFGASPSAEAMGQAKDDWVANGGELLSEFNEVWTCGSQSLSTSMIVRPQPPTPSSTAVVGFTDCTFKDGKSVLDLFAAQKSWFEYLDENEVKATVAYHLPGAGEDPDNEYGVKISTWFPDMQEKGRFEDIIANEGGWMRAFQTFNPIMECNSERVYNATLARGPNR